MMKKIKQQEKAMHSAQRKMTELLEKRWPTGSIVMVLLSYNQQTPTLGTVISHKKNYLRVRLDTKRRAVKDVHFDRVVLSAMGEGE